MSDKIVLKRARRDKEGHVQVEERVMTDQEVRQMNTQIEQTMDDVSRNRPERHAAGPVDPYDIREHEADVVAGRDRKADDWKQVMEYYGFTWFEPEQLNHLIGPERYIPQSLQQLIDRYGRDVYNSRLYWTRPHKVGQYRCDFGNRRSRCPPVFKERNLAFTLNDLISHFGVPEAFDRFAKEMILQWQRSKGAVKVRRR